MALLMRISRGKSLQIGDHTLAFLGREREDDRRFLFRLSHPNEPPTELAAKDDPVCLFDEVIIKVVADSKYSHSTAVRVRIEADKTIRITRPDSN